MVKLSVLSWNVQGINDAKKRCSCLSTLKRKTVDVALLQETHILQQDICKLENGDFKVAAHSSANNRTKGVVILIRSNLKVNVIKQGKDPEGRIAYVKIAINNKIAFISVNAPVHMAVFFSYLCSIIN